jgi:hypothetical protein
MTLLEPHPTGLTFEQKKLASNAIMKLHDVFQVTPKSQRQELLNYVYQEVVVRMFYADGGHDHDGEAA